MNKYFHIFSSSVGGSYPEAGAGGGVALREDLLSLDAAHKSELRRLGLSVEDLLILFETLAKEQTKSREENLQVMATQVKYVLLP